MAGVLKSLILGVDGQTVGPIAVESWRVDALLDWHLDGQRGRAAFMLLGQLPTEMRDDTIRTVALQLARGHVGYIQIEAVRDA